MIKNLFSPTASFYYKISGLISEVVNSCVVSVLSHVEKVFVDLVFGMARPLKSIFLKLGISSISHKL